MTKLNRLGEWRMARELLNQTNMVIGQMDGLTSEGPIGHVRTLFKSSKQITFRVNIALIMSNLCFMSLLLF